MCALKTSFEDDKFKMDRLNPELRKIEQQIHQYLETDPLILAIKLKRQKP